VKPITDWDPTLPLPIVVVINKAMELKVERRYAAPAELLADLKRAAKRIEEGDTTPAISPEAVQRAIEQPVVDDMEGQSRTVMVVESNVELQNLLRERLKRHGYRVLVTSDPERALMRFETDAVLPDCVVFGTGELGRAALDAFDAYATTAKTQNQPAILLVDQKQRSATKNAKLAKHRVVVTMPLKFKEFRTVLRELIANVPQPAVKA
jgi:eukaryotic-like serine/threonine-protein kinase